MENEQNKILPGQLFIVSVKCLVGKRHQLHVNFVYIGEMSFQVGHPGLDFPAQLACRDSLVDLHVVGKTAVVSKCLKANLARQICFIISVIAYK